MAALDYRETRDIYNSLRDAGAVKKSMPEWAREHAARTGSDLFSAGERDGWWTRASTWADENVFEPVASVTTQPVLEAIGGSLGYGDVGAAIGKSLPRSLVNMAPLLIPGLGWGAAAARVGGTGLLTGAHTLAETGSGKAAAVSGVAAGAMIPAGYLGGKIGARFAGAEKVVGNLGDDAINAYLPKTAADISRVKWSGYAGSQVAAQVPAAASAVAQQEILNPDEDFSWKGFVIESALSQIPFTAYDLVKLQRTPLISAADIKPKVAKPGDVIKPATASYVPKAESPEARATVEAILDRHSEIARSPEATPEALAESFKQLRTAVLDPETVQRVKENTRETVRSGEEVELIGRAKKVGDNRWKVFVEEPGSAEGAGVKAEQTVFINGAEPTIENGVARFKVKQAQINKNVEFPMYRSDFEDPFDVATNPPLPDQLTPAARPTEGVTPDVSEAVAALTGDPDWSVPEVRETATLADEVEGAPTYADMLRDSVNTHEEAVSRELVARETISRPLATEEDIAAVLQSEPSGADLVASGVIQVEQPLKFVADNGQHALVTKEPAPGSVDVHGQIAKQWRVTYFEQDGTPSGHDTYDSWQDAYGNVGNRGYYGFKQTFKLDIEVAQRYSAKRVKQQVDNGASPTQAVEQVRLQDNTPAVDSALLSQALAELAAKDTVDKVKTRARKGVKEAEAEGSKLIESYTAIAETNPQAAEVLRLFNEYAGKVGHRKEGQNLLLRAIAKFQNEPEKLEPYFKRIASSQDQASRGAGVPKAEGVEGPTKVGRVDMTRAEAEATIAKLGLGETHAATGAGRGKFRVQEIPKGEVSLDATAGEGDLSLYNLIAQEAPDVRDIIDEVYTSQRPAESLTGMLINLDAAAKNPRVLMAEADFDDVPDTLRAIGQAREVLRANIVANRELSFKEVNDALTKARKTPFKDEAEMRTVMKKVRQGSDRMSRHYKDFTLGSEVPHDPAVVTEMGFERGAGATLDWIATNTPDKFVADLIRGMRKALGSSLDSLPILQDVQGGWHYDPNLQRINVPELPVSREDASGEWGGKFAHEIAHFATRDILNRNDPAAVEFKATIEELRTAIRNNKSIPKKIRDSMKELEAASQKFREDGDEEALAATIKKSLTRQEFKEWFSIIYALHTPDEMVTGIFSSPELVAILRNTTISNRGIVRKAFDYFVDAWHRVMGTSPGPDNGLVKLLDSFENYLSNTGRSRQKPIFQVAGRKDTLLKDERVAQVVRVLAQGNKVTDAFSGSGQLAAFLNQQGGDVTLNVYDPKMRAVFEEVKNNTADFAERVERAVAPIKSSREQSTPTLEDGSSIVDYLTTIEQSDPNIALFIRQNLNAQGREVSKTGFTPTKVLSSVGLRELPSRIREFGPRLANVTGENGWDVVRNAGQGDYVTVDPPYADGSRHYGNEPVTPEVQIRNYEETLYPAAERGAKFVVFDIADPALMASLRQHGFTVEVVQRQSRGQSKTRAELIAYNHDVPELRSATPYNARDYLRDALIADGVRPEALASRMSTLEKVFNTGDLSHSIEGFQREASNDLLPASFVRGDVRPEVLTAISEGDAGAVRENVLGLLAHEVPLHNDLYFQMRQDLNVVGALAKNIEQGFVPGKLPPNMAQKLSTARAKLNSMKRALDKQALDIERFQDILAFTPEGFEELQASQLTNARLPMPPDPTGVEDLSHSLLGLRRMPPRDLGEVRRATAEDKLAGRNTMGPIERALMLTQFTKQLHPAFKAAADHVRRQIADLTQRRNTLEIVYSHNNATGKVDPEIARSNERVRASESMSRAYSDIMLEIQVLEKSGTPWTIDDPFVKKILERYNPADRDAIRQAINSERARHYTWTEVVLPETMTNLSKEQTARVIAAREVGMLPDVARDLSNQVYAGVAAMQDPMQAIVGTEMLRTVSQKMAPETFLAAVRHAQGMVEDVNKHLEFMRTRPTYVSETRYDRHHLVMAGPDNQRFRHSAKDRGELEKVRAKKEAEGYRFIDYIDKADETSPTGIRADVLEQLVALDKQAYTRLEEALGDAPADIKELALSETQRAEQYRTAIEAFKPTPGVTRRFVEGREYLNMMDNAEQFYARANNWLRHRMTRTQTALDMMHPELAGNRELLKYTQDHVDQALTADNPQFRRITEGVYFFRLAFSFGNALLESTQSLTTGMSAMIAETGSVTDAYKLWGKAIKHMTSRDKAKITGRWADPEVDAFMSRAALMGLKEMTTYSDLVDPDTDAVYNISSRKGGKLSMVGQAVKHSARKMSVQMQKMNDIIGLLAGRELGIEKGLQGEELFNFAWDMKERGMFSGGKNQRPVGLWSIKTKPVPQMLSSLQTYTLGWFSQMATNFKVGFKNAPGEFTATQREGARKAFAYSLAAQAVLAGALGMPGMGQGLALVKQATGFDLKGWLRANLADFFGEDEEAGGWMTNLALRGGLAGVSPIDPSNRAAVSFPFLGVDPYKGFDIANLLGAPGTTVSDAVKGALAVAGGDFGAFQKLLPSSFKPAAVLWQGEGDIRDKRGGLLHKLGPMEKVFTALGVPPSKIQASRDTAEAVKNINEQAQRRRQRDVDNLAEAFRKEGAESARLRVLRYLKENEGTDAKELVQAIARRVEAQTIPYDYRRDLNPAADLTGLGSRMPSSEVSRRQTRYGVQEALGLKSRPNPRADQRAILIDQLMDSNPYLTGAEARSVASETLSTRRRNNDLQLLGFQ